MKKLASTFVVLMAASSLSASASASEIDLGSLEASESQAAELGTPVGASGFEIEENTSSAMRLHFQEQAEYVISKAKFASPEQAVAFCTKQGTKLDQEFNALTISMSGATHFNSFLKTAISFRRRGKTGIWQWSGRGKSVTWMTDGQGTDSETILLSELKKSGTVALPAICVKAL